jgi:hypothetical protein
MKKVQETKVIKADQLEIIKEHQVKLNKALTNIGFLETQKHSLLHDYAGIVDDVEKYKVELEEEYGAININIEDGSYTIIEKEEEK